MLAWRLRIRPQGALLLALRTPQDAVHIMFPLIPGTDSLLTSATRQDSFTETSVSSTPVE
jgi:hypothetical protein